MNSIRWHQPLASVFLTMACIAGIRSDTGAVDERPRVVYLGKGMADEDPYFQRFLGAVRRHRPELLTNSRLQFINVDDDDEAELAAALHRIAATRPAVMVAPNGMKAVAARRSAPNTPLVFSSYADPVLFGMATSMLRRPEPSAGIWIADQLDAKRLEILHDAYPDVKHVAVLGDRAWGQNVDADRTLPPAARRLGIALTILYADTPAEADALLANPALQHQEAWCLPRTALTLDLRLVERFRASGKPVIVANTADVHAGAPMSYSLDTSFIPLALVDLVARVIAGEHPGSIPIQRPQRFVLALRTDPEVGLPLPSIHVVRRADLVIR